MIYFSSAEESVTATKYLQTAQHERCKEALALVICKQRSPDTCHLNQTGEGLQTRGLVLT